MTPAAAVRAEAGARPLAGALVLLAMLAAPLLAERLRPSDLQATHVAGLELESAVPRAFGDWQVDPEVVPLPVTPELQKVIDQTYDQTLSRTYVNRNGDRVMLSLAYGTDYGNKGMFVHRPEICYPAQGFEVAKEESGDLDLGGSRLPVRRLVATALHRHEPITYWIVVGHGATRFGWRMRLEQVKAGLTGTVPDGMLVRLSSIDGDDVHAYQLHQAFARALLAALPASLRLRFTGRPGADGAS